MLEKSSSPKVEQIIVQLTYIGTIPHSEGTAVINELMQQGWQMCARAHICQNDMGVNQLLASLV